jgi:hypothetical protein
VQLAESFESMQQATELVFPTEHPLDGIEPFFENGCIEQWLAASLGGSSAAAVGIDVGDHLAIEDGFSIKPTIIDAILADGGSFQSKAHGSGNAPDLRQSLSQQRRLITITRGRNKRRDHIAISITDSDDLVAQLI